MTNKQQQFSFQFFCYFFWKNTCGKWEIQIQMPHNETYDIKYIILCEAKQQHYNKYL